MELSEDVQEKFKKLPYTIDTAEEKNMVHPPYKNNILLLLLFHIFHPSLSRPESTRAVFYDRRMRPSFRGFAWGAGPSR